MRCIYWLNFVRLFVLALIKYIWHIFFDVKSFTDEWASFVKKDILQYDYIRNALLSITTSYLITILIKLDALVSIGLIVPLLLSWSSLFIATLFFLKIFFVLKNFDEGWRTTNQKGDFVKLKLQYSLSKIELSDSEINKYRNNNHDLIELQSRRWIDLIRFVVLLLFASLFLLGYSSYQGFWLKKSESVVNSKFNNMVVIRNKIDSLNWQINSYRLDNYRQYDSLRASMRSLIKQNKTIGIRKKISDK